jgi:hypothetical protein
MHAAGSGTLKPRELMTSIEGLRPMFRSYERNASRLRDILADPSADLGLSFRLAGKMDEPVEMTFSKGSDIARHAALLRPFMAPQSPIELRSVWAALLASGAVDEETRTAIDKAFLDADLLPMAAVVNGTALNARDIYDAYGEGEYFATDEAARARLQAIAVGPMAGLVPLLFHEACSNYSRLALGILEVILELKRKHMPDTADEGYGQCIYCRTTDGPFDTEEHVVPEAFGVDELVLTGCVCDPCNNRLARLDETLAQWEPIALLRTQYAPLTKAGKFPRADLREYEVVKTEPRRIRIRAKGNQRAPVFEEVGDGTVRWTMQSQSRRPFDPLKLARPLFKIALGLIASQAGPEMALEARYDAARAFITGERRFPGYLLVPRVHKPGPEIRTWWQPLDGTTHVAISFYGLQFAFGIEPVAGPAAAIPEQVAGLFWLGDEPEPERGPWPPANLQDE